MGLPLFIQIFKNSPSVREKAKNLNRGMMSEFFPSNLCNCHFFHTQQLVKLVKVYSLHGNRPRGNPPLSVAAAAPLELPPQWASSVENHPS